MILIVSCVPTLILAAQSDFGNWSKSFQNFVVSPLESPPSCGYNSATMDQLRHVIVYSRKGCHLCEIVKESLTKLHKRGGFQWRDVDVDSDPDLRRQYNDQVPVVFINGRKAFKYRMDEQEFLRK